MHILNLHVQFTDSNYIGSSRACKRRGGVLYNTRTIFDKTEPREQREAGEGRGGRVGRETRRQSAGERSMGQSKAGGKRSDLGRRAGG